MYSLKVIIWSRRTFVSPNLVNLHCIQGLIQLSIELCWVQNWPKQSYDIKSPPLWFKILGIFSAENIKRLCVFMFQTWDSSQLLRRVLWISAELTIVSSLKHKNTQPLYIFNRENPQNSEPQNDSRSGLDYIALVLTSG